MAYPFCRYRPETVGKIQHQDRLAYELPLLYCVERLTLSLLELSVGTRDDLDD